MLKKKKHQQGIGGWAAPVPPDHGTILEKQKSLLIDPFIKKMQSMWGLPYVLLYLLGVRIAGIRIAEVQLT